MRQENDGQTPEILDAIPTSPEKKGRNRFLGRMLNRHLLYASTIGLGVGLVGFTLAGSFENTFIRRAEAETALPAPFSNAERSQSYRIIREFRDDYQDYELNQRFDLARALIAENSSSMTERENADNVIEKIKLNDAARHQYARDNTWLFKFEPLVFGLEAGLLGVLGFASLIVAKTEPRTNADPVTTTAL